MQSVNACFLACSQVIVYRIYLTHLRYWSVIQIRMTNLENIGLLSMLKTTATANILILSVYHPRRYLEHSGIVIVEIGFLTISMCKVQLVDFADIIASYTFYIVVLAEM